MPPYPKIKPWESEYFKKWVKTLPCCNCGCSGVDPHHLVGVGNMGGMGMKAPDWALMPLCRACHTTLHGCPEMWCDQWRWIVKTLGQAITEGVLKM